MTALAIAHRRSFSTRNPKLQIAWDSVSSGTAKTCWRKYELRIIEGWQPKFASHHLRYGQLYHRAGEVYDHKRMEGMDHEQALRACLWDLVEGCTDEVADGGVNEDGTACTTRKVWWNPQQWLSEEKAKRDKKTIHNLFRTVIWYLDQFRDDELKTIKLPNGKPAVEVSFSYELGYIFNTGEPLVHCGHFDKLAALGSAVYVVDKKTTAATISGNSAWGYFAKYSPDNQMTGYTFAGKVVGAVPVAGVIIDAAQIAEGFSRFERGFTLRSEKQLEEWRTDFIMMAQLAEHYAEQNYWPMNDTACDLYGGCEFRGVCSKDPQVRPMYLKGDFIRKPWDPLEARGDI